MSQFVYEWREDSDRFCMVGTHTSENPKALTPFGRELCLAATRPLALQRLSGDFGPLPLSDFPCTGLPQPKVLSSRAWKVLEAELSDAGSVVPASIDGCAEPYFLWFPAVIADCLRESESEIFESFSSYRRLVRPVFSKGAVPERVPFIVRGFEQQGVWVRKRFAVLARSDGLLGAIMSRKAPLA